jgi:UDP-glucuronate 4-epimerase
MVSILEKTLNQKAILNNLPMQQGDVDITYADISKAKKYIKYSINTAFLNGIEKYYHFLREELIDI